LRGKENVMKTVWSEERQTGMGATRYHAVLLDKRWIRVSDCEDARYEGREYGVETWEIDVADDAVTASFYRSNSGRERIEASNGLEWKSFEAAERWASGATAPTTCPCCGREM